MSNECDFSGLMDDFIADANGHLDAVENALLDLERGATEEGGALVTGVQGSLHTLKGNAGMMGLAPLQQYLHQLEDVLKKVGEGTLSLSEEVFSLLYAAVNAMRRAMHRLSQDPAGVLDFSLEQGALQAIFTRPGGDTKKQLARGETASSTYVTQKSSTIKVNFEKLDELLNLIGELVVHRTTLENLEKRLREKVSDRELLDAFGESSQQIGKSATELRQAIMKARMLPVKSVFQRFQRLVRDLSLAHDKNVRLVLEGEDTELDKTVLDLIGEPLLHLIRNAVDHGLETQAERVRQGKPQQGTLILRARHENNHIIIAVSDDGRGMSPQRLRSQAVARGVISESAAAAMTDAEALQLVFVPGFSTSSEVTETSGRGIGLDVVQRIVTSLNGIISIDSRVGRGTSFTIMLPLTLAIITALLVEVAGETYAIPLSGVLESIQVDAGALHEIGPGEVMRLRDRILPLHRLDRFFGLQGGASREQEYVVVVGSGEKRGGLIVDRLVGQQEIVIKGLDDYLGDLPGISGGTVLGDGRVALIVDIGSVLGR